MNSLCESRQVEVSAKSQGGDQTVALIRQCINDYDDDNLVCARHNGLTATAWMARSGRGVLVLERADHVRNWDLPVGDPGTVTDALAADAVFAVATIVTDAEATAVDP